MGVRRHALMAACAAITIAPALAFSAPKQPAPLSAVELSVTPVVALREHPVVLPLTLRATAYNSLVGQTDSTPFITATGASTRWGIIAVSRDLLTTDLPYGSLVRLRDLGTYVGGRDAGKYDELLSSHIFIVEDTMHQRKRQQVDVWFASYRAAVEWGVRRLEVEVVRVGRGGPVLVPEMLAIPGPIPVTIGMVDLDPWSAREFIATR
jgi:3D (Asp-Asp-Asp) domain-containing protein